MACVQSAVVRLDLRCDGFHVRPRRAAFEDLTTTRAYEAAAVAGWAVCRATMRASCPACVREIAEFTKREAC